MDRIVLCGASSYEQKYYFNEEFLGLPQSIQEELHIMCVMFTEEIGGVLTLFFDESSELKFEVEALDGDGMFDEIGSALRIKELQRTKEELFTSLQLYYKVFFLGETALAEQLTEE